MLPAMYARHNSALLSKLALIGLHRVHRSDSSRTLGRSSAQIIVVSRVASRALCAASLGRVTPAPRPASSLTSRTR